MATLSGHRTAARVAAATAALLCAALTVGASPASAAPAGGPTVEFSGGSVLSLLVCRSAPSTDRVTVPADSRVTFVNRLGQAATLKVDGRSAGAIGSNQAVPVVFHQGPVNVSMAFSCGVGVVEEFKAVGVNVTPLAGSIAMTPTSRPGPPVGSSVLPRSGTAATGTGTSPRAGAVGGSSAGGSKATDQGANGAASSAAEPVDPSLPGPDASTSPAAAAGAPSTGPDARVFVEAAVPASGTPHNGPAGLLALIATVCVVGVGMAAIRAIIAQRSTRARLA
jgi:hypothetical protein